MAQHFLYKYEKYHFMYRKLSFLCIAVLILSCCGQTGPLYLPDHPEKTTEKSK